MDTVDEQLRTAAQMGHEAELKALLLDPTCDPLTKYRWGATALMGAAWHGHIACLRLLLPVSDPLSKDGDGMTALMWTAMSGHLPCVQLLLPVSDPLVTNKSGKTASEIATRRGYPEVARLIDAYALAMSEMTILRSSTGPGVHRLKSLPRL